MADTAALLAQVADAQHKLSQLESTARGLVDELASGATQPSPRLRQLLASGEQLVAAVQQAARQLGTRVAEAPVTPDRATIDTLWAQQLPPERHDPALLPTPVSQPASSLGELAGRLRQHLPGCTLQLLAGCQVAPAERAGEATAVVLRCGRAFAAVVHLQRHGGLLPLRVGVLSAAEADAALAAAAAAGDACASGHGSGGSSLWSPSQHAVFCQLAALAAAALRHFLETVAAETQQQQQQQSWQGLTGTAAAAAAGARDPAGAPGGASPLELLLLWLATCGDVFTRRSAASGQLLGDAAAPGGGLLPPLHRPWRLGWVELWQAALNPQLRQAEHAPPVW